MKHFLRELFFDVSPSLIISMIGNRSLIQLNVKRQNRSEISKTK